VRGNNRNLQRQLHTLASAGIVDPQVTGAPNVNRVLGAAAATQSDILLYGKTRGAYDIADDFVAADL
jgi:hypothetical protein